MNRKSRIGLIHWAFAPTTGGVESHLADLGRLFTQVGCQVTVITGELEPVLDPGFEVISTRLLNLAYIRTIPVESVGYVRELRAFLRDIVSTRKLDLVHGHNLHHFRPEPAIVLDDLHRELGFRIHHTFHETWPDVLHESPVYSTWEGNYAVSEFVWRQCHDRLSFSPRLLPLGVDLEVFQPTRKVFSTGSAVKLIHPARLLPWKGVHLSVQALGQLRREGVRATLVVTDTQRIIDWHESLNSYRREVLSLISDLDLAKQVEFRAAAYSQIPVLYNEADIVLYPTIGEEPFGLVPVEAMSCERPVVASRSGGISETIVDGETGYLTERGDVESLASAIHRLVENPKQAEQMGRAGRRRVEALFNIRDYVSALMEYYRA
jgi:glycosyltransferase involved in cell wall biosynthesis